MSPGNGHPYSWSAIFNGYDVDAMRECEFPAIPEYLAKEKYPASFLGDLAEVTHIWTQDSSLSMKIAKASKIAHVCGELEEMIPEVDAVLLARDDASNHPEMARPFLNAGLPIFIDKPFALSLKDANGMLADQQYETQIFSCSSLLFAEEFSADKLKFKASEVIEVEAFTPKYWDTYAAHIIDPSFNILGDWTEIIDHEKKVDDETHQLRVTKKSGRRFSFTATRGRASNIEIKLKTRNEEQSLIFKDSFKAFKSSLEMFVKQIRSKKLIIERNQSLNVVACIELGS